MNSISEDAGESSIGLETSAELGRLRGQKRLDNFGSPALAVRFPVPQGLIFGTLLFGLIVQRKASGGGGKIIACQSQS